MGVMGQCRGVTKGPCSCLWQKRSVFAGPVPQSGSPGSSLMSRSSGPRAHKWVSQSQGSILPGWFLCQGCDLPSHPKSHSGMYVLILECGGDKAGPQALSTYLTNPAGTTATPVRLCFVQSAPSPGAGPVP